MPAILIFLFGFALSLDVTNVPVAVVLEAPSPDRNGARSGLSRSRPISRPTKLTSMPRAQQLLLQQKVDGIIRIRSDFARQLNSGSGQGPDSSSTAPTPIAPASSRPTLRAPSRQYLARRAAEGHPSPAGGSVVVQSRLWFNEANDSHYFLVPGLIVLIMTLIGAFLTALVMAREWERGTLEALFVTPVRAGEIVVVQDDPLFRARHDRARALHPFRQVSVRRAVSRLGTGPDRRRLRFTCWLRSAIGLSISSLTKSQFVASMATMVITFLPAVMLSGFLFDLRSMPAAIRVISYALPARYYVDLLQTLFLAGNIWGVIAAQRRGAGGHGNRAAGC